MKQLRSFPVKSGRKVSVKGLSFGLAATAGTLLAFPADATSITIDFVGTGPYTPGYYYPLTNSLTNTDALPALAVQAGDVIDGIISFPSAITVPFNSYFTSSISFTGTNGAYTDYIGYTANLLYYNGSTNVTPAGLGVYGGSVQGLTLGNYAYSGTPAFTFDRIAYSATIDYFLDQNSQTQYDSMTLPEGVSSFYLWVVPSTSNVPEPVTWAMMIAGFGMVGLGARRRRGMRVPLA